MPDDESVELVYDDECIEKEPAEEYRWSLEPPVEPGWYGFYPAENAISGKPEVEVVAVTPDGFVASDRVPPSELDGIWFYADMGGPGERFEPHFMLFAGPPVELVAKVHLDATEPDDRS